MLLGLMSLLVYLNSFFFNDTATTEIYTLSLHDALPIFEPTVFGKVDNHSTIGREEIFGPVLCVIAADDEQDAIRTANDSIYGLNASVFTNDIDRALAVARQLRSGTVGHNASRTDF